MDPQPKLLDHPFYQAWTRGEVTPQTLGMYHRSYGEFIRAMPTLWKRVVDALQPGSALGATVVQDEVRHTALWETWGSHVPTPGSAQSMLETLCVLEDMTPSALLGALQAFELQQPEVARVKKEGLVNHYGIPESDLAYFHEHEDEAKHIAFGQRLANDYAVPEEYAEGFRRGAELVYHSLDGFATS